MDVLSLQQAQIHLVFSCDHTGNDESRGRKPELEVAQGLSGHKLCNQVLARKWREVNYRSLGLEKLGAVLLEVFPRVHKVSYFAVTLSSGFNSSYHDMMKIMRELCQNGSDFMPLPFQLIEKMVGESMPDVIHHRGVQKDWPEGNG